MRQARPIRLLLAAALLTGCTSLTPEQIAQMDVPLHLQVLGSPEVQKRIGSDPVILNSLIELLQKSDRIGPDISKIADTPFEDVLGVGSPAGYFLRNRYLHPGVPLAEALAQNPDPALHARLVEAARWERSAEVRTTALIALARMREAKDYRIFQEAVAHLNPAIRFGTMEALLVWGFPDKAKPLLKLAAENDVQRVLRVFAAGGLAALGDPEGLAKLRTFLRDTDWMVRAMAVRYIGDFGEAEDYDVLVRRIGQEEGNDFVLAEHCIAALKLFPKKQAKEDEDR